MNQHVNNVKYVGWILEVSKLFTMSSSILSVFEDLSINH